MELFLFISAIVVGIIILGAFLDKNNTLSKIQDRNKQLSTLPFKEDFESSKQYSSSNKSSMIEIDEKKKKIRLSQFVHYHDDGRQLLETKTYNFTDIVESEIIMDNNSLIKTSRTSQLAGIAIGSLLAGNLGAVIGGLSGDKQNIEYIKNIDLKVRVNDFERPSYKINFLSNINEVGIENKKGLIKNDHKCQIALQDVEYWYNILNLIIKQNNK